MSNRTHPAACHFTHGKVAFELDWAFAGNFEHFEVRTSRRETNRPEAFVFLQNHTVTTTEMKRFYITIPTKIRVRNGITQTCRQKTTNKRKKNKGSEKGEGRKSERTEHRKRTRETERERQRETEWESEWVRERKRCVCVCVFTIYKIPPRYLLPYRRWIHWAFSLNTYLCGTSASDKDSHILS